jgi:hypothetical protein
VRGKERFRKRERERERGRQSVEAISDANNSQGFWNVLLRGKETRKVTS